MRGGWTLIIDSVRGYFGSEVDVLCLVKIMSKRAQNQSRSGCFVIADMGSFYLIRMVNELVKYEASMPLKFDTYDGRSKMYKPLCDDCIIREIKRKS